VQPVEQMYSAVPPSGVVCGAHIGVDAAHVMPHPPQFVGLVVSASQPMLGVTEQCAWPGAHAEETLQVPFTHVT
jgi:hypothetical protein